MRRRASAPSSPETLTRAAERRCSAQRGEAPSDDQKAAGPRAIACSPETRYPRSARATSAVRTSEASWASAWAPAWAPARARTRSSLERRPSTSGSRSQWICPVSRVLNASDTSSTCPPPIGRNSRCGVSAGLSTRPPSAAVVFFSSPRGALPLTGSAPTQAWEAAPGLFPSVPEARWLGGVMPSIAPMSAAARDAISGISRESASKSSEPPAAAITAPTRGGAVSAAKPSSATNRRIPWRFRHRPAASARRSATASGIHACLPAPSKRETASREKPAGGARAAPLPGAGGRAAGAGPCWPEPSQGSLS